MSQHDVVLIGGGMAGLACALHLHERGRTPLLLEAGGEVGGRVRTDQLDGFLLDRGFQVLLTGYPEARALLDFDALELGYFEPGALVYADGRFHRVSDPFRRPRHALATLTSPVGSLADKLRVLGVRRRATRGDLDALFLRDQMATIDHLRARGFSEQMIDRFFRPFLGGIFLENELQTSSRIFEFVFRMFSRGYAAIPARGMGELARQLRERLPAHAVRTHARVDSIADGRIVLEGGEQIRADAVVVATEAAEAGRLIGGTKPPKDRGVACLYFAAEHAPCAEPILVLNGSGEGPINNLCVPSQVAPGYAPDGKSLISVSVVSSIALADPQIENSVRRQLVQWYGEVADRWRLLRIYRIPRALPDQSPISCAARPLDARVRRGLYRCGDHMVSGSLQGALLSGRRAADAVLADF